MTEWVKVEDQLPENWQSVLAWAPDGTNQAPNLLKQCVFIEGSWSHGYHGNRLSGVTHWMPEPEPPESLEEDL